MAHELEVFSDPGSMAAAMQEVAAGTRNDMLLAKWGGGILEFADVVFPGVGRDDIFAQSTVREAEGRGPHFDVYKSFVDEDHQWLGHYNLSGNASIRTTELPDDLADSYFGRFPVPSDAAFDARRHFSRIALEAPGAEIATGTLEPMTGFVLPVRSEGPHIVHEIVPVKPEEPGAFVKMLVAPKGGEVREDLRTRGYEPLDMFCTRALGATIQAQQQKPDREWQKARRIPSLIRPDRSAPYKRPCNLD